MASIIKALISKKILVSDGAWGTMLQQKGLKPGECPEQWNLDHPDDVYEIAVSYINAGSDLIEIKLLPCYPVRQPERKNSFSDLSAPVGKCL